MDFKGFFMWMYGDVGVIDKNGYMDKIKGSGGIPSSRIVFGSDWGGRGFRRCFMGVWLGRAYGY